MVTKIDPELLIAFNQCFNNPEGEMVLDYLYEIVKYASLDSRKPDPNQAVYRCAQDALLYVIQCRLEEFKDL